MKEKPNTKHVKCPQCGEYELWKDKDEMIKERVKERNVYIHNKCHDAYLAEIKEKKRLQKERITLFNYIKRLHDTEIVPPSLISMIELLRTGSKKNKLFSYRTVLVAYEMSTKKIKYYIQNKKFKDINKEVIYCFQIVKGNILNAQQKEMEESRSRKIAEAKQQRIKETNESSESRKVEYKRREYEDDIIDFLE